jgi:crossover junction endodeoxyribonuclease RuvC
MEGRMIIGIDPGISGALAFLDDKFCLLVCVDMPTMILNKSKNQVNAAELASIISSFSSSSGTIAHLERVAAMPGQGVVSMFNFGMAYGVVQGILGALRIPVILVSPVVWKKRAGLQGKDKDMARTVAQHLYPGASLARKKDIGKADAILIARFGGDCGH